MPVTTIAHVDGLRSARDLVDLHDRLGVPHFQRGLVWDSDSVALLLESLFHGTPCGSIILWRPDRPGAQGVSLGTFPPEYLIVDGQQRIRSLYSVFGSERSSIDDSAPSVDEDPLEHQRNEPRQPKCWCLNLGRIPAFSGRFPGGKRFALFRFAKDPRFRNSTLQGAPLQDQQALLPLKWFVDQDNDVIRQLISQDRDGLLAEATLAVLDDPSVYKRLRGMRDVPVFYVSTLGFDVSLGEVVDTYNRINSAGKRVEAEEKAFANLAAVYPGVDQELKAFFDSIPSRDASLTRDMLGRDNLLTRQRESQFGFKLFMRVFMIAFAYHSDRTIGSSTFSFDSATREGFEHAVIHLSDILRLTRRVLTDIASVLSGDLLCCDDFRMLPETTSLWPILQLFIRFPDLMKVSRAPDVVAGRCLRLMSANLTKNELLKLCGVITDAQSVSEALTALDKAVGLEEAKASIEKGVHGAQSLTDRYTLMLYWILRKRRAKDFSYDANVQNLPEFSRKHGYSEEQPISRQVNPEKQHIVPYKALRTILNVNQAGRPGRHPINDIGNLTYISAALNSFEDGLGSQPLQLNREPATNLDAHMLSDITAYEEACRPENPNARLHFETFCKTRRDSIAATLSEWLEHSSAAMIEDVRIHPSIRLISRRPEDHIRELDYEQPIAEALLGLGALGRMRVLKSGVRTIVLLHGRNQVVRIDLFDPPTGIGLKLREPGIAARFAERFLTVGLAYSKGSAKCRLTATNSQELMDVLEWVRKEAITLPAEVPVVKSEPRRRRKQTEEQFTSIPLAET